MSVSFDLSGYSDLQEKKDLTDDYMENLRLRAQLNKDYEEAVIKSAKRQDRGLQELPKYKSYEEEQKDTSRQYTKALANIKKSLYLKDAEVFFDMLRTNIDDLKLFNTYWSRFYKEIGPDTGMNPTVYRELWDRYKDKIAKTKGILIGIEEKDLTDLGSDLKISLNELKISLNELKTLGLDTKSATDILLTLSGLDPKSADDAFKIILLYQELLVLPRLDVDYIFTKLLTGDEKTNPNLVARDVKKIEFLNATGKTKSADIVVGKSNATFPFLYTRPSREEMVRFIITHESKEDIFLPWKINIPQTAIITKGDVLFTENMSVALSSIGALAKQINAKRGLKGTGVITTQITEDLPVKRGRGRPPSDKFTSGYNTISSPKLERFKSFGNYDINMNMLSKNKLSVVFPKSNNKPAAFKGSQLISSHLAQIIAEVVNDGKINVELYENLDDLEQKTFDKLAQISKLSYAAGTELYRFQTATDKVRNEKIKRFNLLRSELIAGNDSPEAIKELKALLFYLKEDHIITSIDFNKIMRDIVLMG